MSSAPNQVAPIVDTQPGGQPAVYAQPPNPAMPGQNPALVGQNPLMMAQPGALYANAAAMQPPPPVWMPKPSSGPVGCPPGLEYLTQVDQLLVKQQKDLLEMFTNWEVKNKYRILNSLGQQVYYAKEESDTCMRQCCTSNRSFIMHITDNAENNKRKEWGCDVVLDTRNRWEVIRLEREFRCWRDSNWCAFCDCCAHRIVVEAPVGTVVGYVKQKPSFVAPRYVLMDANEKEILYIEGPCCVCPGCPCDVNFNIYSALDGQTEVGRIQKQWSNLLQEMFTSADNFGVTFPMDLDIKMKAVMLGATFLIDFMYFEQQNRGGHHHY